MANAETECLLAEIASLNEALSKSQNEVATLTAMVRTQSQTITFYKGKTTAFEFILSLGFRNGLEG